MKRYISILCLCMIFLSGTVPMIFGTDTSPTTLVVLRAVEVMGGANTPLVFKNRDVVQGQTLTFDVGFSDVKDKAIQIRHIQLITSTDITVFPFAVIDSSYYQTANIYHFSMRCRGDAPANQFYTIPFSVTYTVDGVTESQTVPVSVLVRPSSSDDNGGSLTGYPKLTVSEYRTIPDPVVAGEQIELMITIKNNGNVTASNMKCTYASGGEFTAVSGASSLFISAIAGGASSTQRIQLKVKSDTAPGSYAISFTFTYDVQGASEPVTDSESVTIPIIQIPRVQMGDLVAEPEETYLGNEANVMTTVSNIGKTILYNVNARFSDAAGNIKELTKYIGNIAPGESVDIDEYLQTVNVGEVHLVLLIVYEDGEGNKYDLTKEKTFTIVPYNEEIPEPSPYPIEKPTEGGGIFQYILIILVIIGIGVAAFIVVRKRKKSSTDKERDRQQVLDSERQLLMEEQNRTPSNDEDLL